MVASLKALITNLGPQSSAAAVRLACRQGKSTHTAGLASNYVQGNLVILPKADAEAFRRFCELNKAPCPLLAVGEPGDPTLPTLGLGVDIRKDVPLYKVRPLLASIQIYGPALCWSAYPMRSIRCFEMANLSKSEVRFFQHVQSSS